MAQLTPEQFAKKFDQISKGLPKEINKAAIIAANELRGLILTRLFSDGRAADGVKIGNYSTAPMLIGKSSFTTATAANAVLGSKAKRSELEWRKVKGRNLAILPGGYKELRRLSNRRTDTVDLNFRGNLQRSFGKLASKRFIERNGNTYIMRINGDEQVDKARGNERRFRGSTGTIFAASAKEEATAKEVYREVLEEYFNKFI